jgi:serine/threonine protein kinase
MDGKSNALSVGYRLQEYCIEAILGAGGFGITYQARDTHLSARVAIKEYFPVELVCRDSDGCSVCPTTPINNADAETPGLTYQQGLERFLSEAQVLASIQHPSVVRVKRYFRTNGTAYIVMDYEDGQTLGELLKEKNTLTEDEIHGLLTDVLPALQAVHDQGYLHRDLKPSNLYVRCCDGGVMLIDFGAAREAVKRCSRSITSLVSPGYSPPEQYVTRIHRCGNWTDLYALGAVLYRCITGTTPMEASERLLNDRLLPATLAGAGRFSPKLLEAVDRAMAVRPEDRYQNVAEMQVHLHECTQTSLSHQTSALKVSRGELEIADYELEPPTQVTPFSSTYRTNSHWPTKWFAGGIAMILTVTIGFLWSPPQKPIKTEIAETLIGSLADLALPTFEPPFKVPQIQPIEHQEPQDQDADSVLTSNSDTTPAHMKNKEVKRFLTLAGESLRDYRLTIPADNSALHFYRRVLALDPQNARALRGFKEIATRYAWLAERAIEHSQHAKAKRYIELGLSVDPQHPHLLALQEQTGASALTNTLETLKEKLFAEPESAVRGLRGFQNK